MDAGAPLTAGTYFGMVEEVRVEADEDPSLLLDFVKVDEELLTDDGPETAFAARTRSNWRGATAPAAEDVTRRRAAREIVDDFDSLTTGVALIRLEGDEPQEFERWLIEDAWVRFKVDPDGLASDFEEVERHVARRLLRCFSSESWYSATAADVTAALSGVVDIERAVFHDVGQAAAVSLFSGDRDRPIAYFDVGLAFGRNRRTRPSSIGLCLCEDTPVILSHWDTDHWGAVDTCPDLYARTWVVPRQVIGASHAKAAARIARDGRLLVVKRSSRPQRFSGRDGQVLRLHHGSGTKRNHSGLILVIESRRHDACWVFPGDASYASFPVPTRPATVLQATHHGGTFGPIAHAAPKPPPSRRYARIVYSFGPNNSFNHPSAASLAHHTRSGWGSRHARDTGGTKRTAVVVGWNSKVLIPFHMRGHESSISL